MIEIIYACQPYIASYNDAVRIVAEERKYLATTQGFPLESTIPFVLSLIEKDLPQYYAIDQGRVVGWCDILPEEKELLRHIGVLGMGVLPGYRGQGLGKRLLTATLDKSRAIGLDKVELEVYADNIPAQKLYLSMGFLPEGTRVNAIKLDGKYIDLIRMGMMLESSNNN